MTSKKRVERRPDTVKRPSWARFEVVAADGTTLAYTPDADSATALALALDGWVRPAVEVVTL